MTTYTVFFNDDAEHKHTQGLSAQGARVALNFHGNAGLADDAAFLEVEWKNFNGWMYLPDNIFDKMASRTWA